MQSHGIYTLANDAVYDQLVALLNSIEVNISPKIPVCIIPYNARLDKVKQEVNSRANLTLFDNWESIQRWENFAHQVWAVHPGAKKARLSRNWWSTGHLQRKMCAFDGNFDKFVFYDADSLAMKPLDDVFEKLDNYDFVFNDWEHIKLGKKAALDVSQIEKTGLWQRKDIQQKLHCSSFFGSKKGIFNPEELSVLKKHLIENGEVAWVPRWWDDAFLFTYMTWRCDRPLFNFTLSPNGQDRTGNCADADPFVNIDNVLYNEQGLKPIHRLHYMNYPSIGFTRLSRGEDVDIRYKEVFLHYRFLKQPENKPKKFKPPNHLQKGSRLMQKAIKKLQRAFL